jgi:hypothetical protein
MKTYWGVEELIRVFLVLALVGCEWSDSRPYRFTPGRDWVGPRISVWTIWRNNSLPVSGSDPSFVQTVARRYTDCAIPVPSIVYFIALT